MKGFLLAAAATLLSLLVTHCEAAVTMCPDDYAYTKQPPVGLACNPYITRTLTIDCAVTGPEGIEIRWYYSSEFQDIDSPFHESAMQLLNSTKYLQINRTIRNGIALTLTINDLTDDDAGSYWCQPFAIDGTFYLSSSASTIIRDEDFYSAIFFVCPPMNINAQVGCATILEFPESVTVSPTTSLALPDTTTVAPLPLPETVSSKASYSPSPTPSGLANIISSTANPTPSSPETPNTSAVILYVVLALVGFLVIVCCLLCTVICCLWRKRSQKIGLEGSDDRDSGFETLSLPRGQSDSLQTSSYIFKGRMGHLPYHPDISMQISSTTRSPHNSGDYAEIGPALVTVRSQPNNLNTMHDYSEIPAFINSRPETSATLASSRSDSQEPEPYLVAGRENPYDVPILPDVVTQRPQDLHEVEPIEEEEEEEEERRGEEEEEEEEEEELATDRTVASNHDVPVTHDYHTLEDGPNSSGFTGEDSLLTPPLSPHNYHILEELGREGGDPLPLSGISAHLETIPEHPYHTLEESSLPREDYAPQQLPYNSLEEATPGFTDPEIKFEEFSDFPSPKPAADDGDYDKLIGPPHLLQILERSPSAIRPRIREIPLGYSRLDSRVAQPASSTFHPPTPQTKAAKRDETLSDCSSSTGSENMFDDPQYIVSPRQKSPLSHTVSDGGVPSASMSHRRTRTNSSGTDDRPLEEARDMAKYLGDYERDPSYMAQLRENPVTDGRLSEQSTKRLSLPEFSHVYQSLEVGKMDPFRHYERLKAAGTLPTGKETAI